MCTQCGCAADGATVLNLQIGRQSSVQAHTDGTRHSHAPGSRVVDLNTRLLGKNDALAARNRAWFARRRILALNLVSSPGAGKTTLLASMPSTITCFQAGEVTVVGIFGYVLLRLGFHPAPILLGFVLGPRFELNFRRAMLSSRGDIMVFVERPISAVFVVLCVVLIAVRSISVCAPEERYS